MNNHFKIIVCCYNVEKWVSTTIKSIKSQTYGNFKCTVVDASSEDGTVEKIKEAIGDDSRFEVIINDVRKFPLQNQFDTFKNWEAGDEDIVVTVDGDDWLYNNNVLQCINDIYEREDVVLTYGSYVNYPHGKKSQLRLYPKNIIENNDYRKYDFLSSHLRTFKYKVFKALKKESLLSSWNNEFYKKAGDYALMIPLLEISGKKIYFVDKPLYVYNVYNPLNENKVDVEMIHRVVDDVKKKQKYNSLF